MRAARPVSPRTPTGPARPRRTSRRSRSPARRTRRRRVGMTGPRYASRTCPVSVVNRRCTDVGDPAPRRCVGHRLGIACPRGRSDPLAPLAELPGVARRAMRPATRSARAHRHRANLRGWPATAAEAAVRAARASSVLDGGSLTIRADDEADPVLAGALRVAEALEGGATTLVGVWQRAPLQAIARLHALAAADLTDDDRLGRPRPDPDVGAPPRAARRRHDRRHEGSRAGAGGGRARRAADAGAVRRGRRRGGASRVAADHHRPADLIHTGSACRRSTGCATPATTERRRGDSSRGRPTA